MDRKKILLVDDTTLFLKIQESFLDRENFIIYTAGSGIEALKKAVENQPDLILLDLHMPDLNGDEVCSRLKAMDEFKDVPVLIVTAEDKEHVFKPCIEAGCDGFIIKPFDKNHFLNKIREHLAVRDREFVRISTSISGTIMAQSGAVAAPILNLSEGGAFIRSDSPPSPGTMVDLRFSVPGMEGLISNVSVVRWYSEYGEPPGFGVEFLNLPDKSRTAIADYIASFG